MINYLSGFNLVDPSAAPSVTTGAGGADTNSPAYIPGGIDWTKVLGQGGVTGNQTDPNNWPAWANNANTTTPPPSTTTNPNPANTDWSTGPWDANRVRAYFQSRGVTPNATSPDYWAGKWNEWGQKDPAYFLKFLSNAEEFTGGPSQTAQAMWGTTNPILAGSGVPYLTGIGGGNTGGGNNSAMNPSLLSLLTGGKSGFYPTGSPQATTSAYAGRPLTLTDLLAMNQRTSPSANG